MSLIGLSIRLVADSSDSAIVVGCPPAYRGGTTKGTDLELHLIKLFPQTAYFIEKVSY